MSLFIDTLFRYVFKRRKDKTLNCGIFAWVGESPEQFSSLMFNILGVYNDSRGGDSCGVYFNKGAIYGIKSFSRYEALVKEKKLHTTITPGKNPVMIGHCRKASVGAVNEVNVQPVIIRNPDKNDRITYVQAHNGTISNHDDLAKKYNVHMDKDESDSKTLAKLVEKLGFKILKEYEGSAALIMYFLKEPNTLYAFRGQSKNYYTMVEERPLHYIQISGGGTYISSEANPLEFIGNGAKATEFKCNMVYKISGNEVTEHLKVDRENLVSKKAATYHYPSTTEKKDHDAVVPWKLPFSSKQSVSGLRYEGVTKNICSSKLHSRVNVDVRYAIRYRNGFFYVNDFVAHGRYIVDQWGFVKDSAALKSTTLKTYCLYFYLGHLVYDRSSFSALDKEGRSNSIYEYADLKDNPKYNSIESLLKEHCIYPFTKPYDNPGSGYMKPSDLFEQVSSGNHFFSGSFVPLFSDYELHFDKGDLTGYKVLEFPCLMSEFFKEFDYLKDLHFGTEHFNTDKEPEPEVIDKQIIRDCVDCYDKGYDNHGENCQDCLLTNKMPEPTKKAKVEPINDDAQMKEMIVSSIGNSLEKIVEDIDDVIDEVNSSGFEHLMQNEIGLMTGASDLLKNVVK